VVIGVIGQQTQTQPATFTLTPLDNDTGASLQIKSVATNPGSFKTFGSFRVSTDKKQILYTLPADLATLKTQGFDIANYTVKDAQGRESTAELKVLRAETTSTANQAAVQTPGGSLSVTSETGSTLSNVQTTTTLPPGAGAPPANVDFPGGFLSFTLKGASGNKAQVVNLTFEKAINAYYKFGPTPDNTTPHWYNFTWDETTKTGAKITGTSVALHFVDGLRGDDDLTENGTIVDPGAPAFDNTINVPVAALDQATVGEDDPVSVSVLANDTDADGDTISLVSYSDGASGTVLRVGDVLTYQPDTDFTGEDIFTYTISDGNGGTAIGAVSVTVTPVNDAPIGVADAFSIDEDQVLAISGLIDNDTDVDSGDLTLVSVNAAQRGNVTRLADGSYTYTPPADYSGSDLFVYVVSDGELESYGKVNVTIAPVNDAPVAGRDIAELADGQDSIAIEVLSNDTDVDSQSLAITAVGTPTHGTAAFAGGVVTYTVGPSFTTTDTFTYTVSDGDGASTEGEVSISLGAAGPRVEGDEAATTEDAAVTIAVLANDFDPNGDAISVVSVEGASNGTVSVDVDGTVTYTPNADFNGTDSFTYTVSDGALTGVGTVTVAVSAVNDAPRFAEGSPVFVSPANGAEVEIGSALPDSPASQLSTVTVEFNPAADPEGTAVSYRWQASGDASMSPVALDSTLTSTSLQLLVSDLAALTGSTPGAALQIFHRVTASDGELETVSAVESATLVRGYITGTGSDEVPAEFALDQNYPNPFNPVTLIRYSLPLSSIVSIDVFDSLGRHVAQLVSGQQSAGNHEVSFDAGELPSGVYMYLMKAEGFAQTRTLVLLR
jgi:hypothetical protein